MPYVIVGRIAIPAKVAMRLRRMWWILEIQDESLLLQIPGAFVTR